MTRRERLYKSCAELKQTGARHRTSASTRQRQDAACVQGDHSDKRGHVSRSWKLTSRGFLARQGRQFSFIQA